MPPLTFALLTLAMLAAAGATISVAFAGGATAAPLGLIALVSAGVLGWSRFRQ